MEELILIKLGGSVITDKGKEFTAREDNIKRFAKEISEAQKVFKGKIIIGHGAGSFAHTPAAKFETRRGIINDKSILGASIVEDSARALNAILTRNFLTENVPIFSFSPGSFLISDGERSISSYFDPIRKALEIGLVPVVYGDVIIDKTQGFTIFSTEKVFETLVQKLNETYKIRMIYVTDVDGVYDKKGNTIPVITRTNFDQLKTSILGAKGVDVTGGMLHKVEESLKLSEEFGTETLILNGNKNGSLQKAILKGKIVGTKVI